jgi:hypothetical protein
MRFLVSLRRYAAVTTLLIVPAVVVEFLTGNTTFAADPGAVLNIAHYGSGAVLVRELARSWQKGFASILILGAVYGMFNEGLATGGFFDPNFYAVAGWDLENYGRWGGINVVWALNITVFHAVFSIAVPIIIVDALFPDLAPRRLLGNTSLVAFFILLAAVTALARLILSPTQPPIKPHALALVIVLMLLLTLLARVFPSFAGIAVRRAPSDIILIISAFVGSFSWIVVIPTALSYIHLPIVNVLTVFCVLFLISWLLLGFAKVSNRQRLALAAGAEGPLLAHAVTSAIFVPLAVVLALLAAAWRSSGNEARARTPMLQTVLFAGAAFIVGGLIKILLQRLFA